MSSVSSVAAVSAASSGGGQIISVPASTLAAPVTPASTPASSIVQAVTPTSGAAPSAQINNTSPTTTSEAQSASNTDAQKKKTSASTESSLNPRLPLGLLLSITPPPSANISASSDYVRMQDALRTNNLAAAQQAYQRLQGDLNMGPATETADQSVQSGKAVSSDTTANQTSSDTSSAAHQNSLNAIA